MTSPPDPDDLTSGSTGDGPGPAFGGFDMGDLLSQALDMQRQMAEAQEELGATDVVGEAGGGVVRITLTGHFEVRSVHLDRNVVDPDEADLLADLVTAALRNAIDGVMALQAERMGGGLPDLGGLLEDLGGMGGMGGRGGMDVLGGLGGALGAGTDPDPDLEVDADTIDDGDDRR